MNALRIGMALAAVGGLAACHAGGASSSTASTNPQDPAFGAVNRTTNEGGAFFIAPVPATGAANLNAETPGAVQVGTVSGPGQSSFRWSGRRSLTLCAPGRTVDGPAQVTVGGEPFTIVRSCDAPVVAAATPPPGGLSPFGGPMPTGPVAPPPRVAPAYPQAPTGYGPPPVGSAPVAPAPPGGYGPPPGGERATPSQSVGAGLPPRRPGLWRTTITGPDGQQQGQQEVCLDAERAANWSPDADEQQQCPRYRVVSQGGVVYGDAVCNTANGQMHMQAQFMGDWGSAYQGAMTVEVQTPQGPVRQQMRLQSRWVGPCAAN